MIGKTLSHYKVLEKIGEGGMGEVYRAEDTNLSREVAIKVLPEQFTKDPQRLARMDCQGQPSEGVGSHPLKPLNCLLTLGPYLSHFR